MEFGFMPKTAEFHHRNPRKPALGELTHRATHVLIAFGLLLSLPINMAARLWDSEREIERQYGPCVTKVNNDPVFGNVSVYHYQQYEVRVTFIEGKSQSEYYIHRDLKTPLTSQEIDFLLEVNSSGRTWKKSPDLPLWRLADSEAFAIYRGENGGGLGICTAKFLERQQAK